MGLFKRNKTKGLLVIAFLFTIAFLTGSIYSKAEGKFVKVHYIDVGQADSILIQSSNANLLIDAGNRDDDQAIIKYLKQQGVKKLDYLVGTHPHEDHIGGMASILKEFNVGNLIMPKVTTTTKTFEYLLNTIKNKGLKITTPIVGKTFQVGAAKFVILAPNDSKYEDLNNYSVVLKMTCGKNSFLFQGDAEKLSEQEIINKGFSIKADVLKLGHHGSNSSTSTAYLDKVKPQFAIISCGKGNDYGHPHKEIIKRLEAKKTKYYRTDVGGTIVCTTDGNKVKFISGKAVNQSIGSPAPSAVANNSASNTQSGAATSAVSVYVTKTGQKYHLESCSSLKTSKLKISLKDAKAKGYEPCSICSPQK
jgi:competence protein ComEC